MEGDDGRESLDQKVQEALNAAQAKAVRMSHQQIDVEHLLCAARAGARAGAVDPEEGRGRSRGRSSAASSRSWSGCRKSRATGPPDQVYVTGRLNRLLAQAEDEAKKLKDEYVSVEHLLLAMTDDSGAAGKHPQGVRRHPRPAACRRCRKCAATSASPRRTRRRPTRRWKVRPRPDPARRPGQARPGHRPRRGDPPRHPGAVAAAPRTTRC